MNFLAMSVTQNTQGINMKPIQSFLLAIVFPFVIAMPASAETLRCKGDIVQVGDTKATVTQKCGSPAMTDSFCEKTERRIRDSSGKVAFIETCENVDIWTYNPGKGQFWTNLYFAEGELREMKYGKRVD
jgi:hypothetical protein